MILQLPASEKEDEQIGPYRSQGMGRGRFKPALTLVELLVVMSILSVLMGIVVPAAVRVRCKARTMLSMNNQKQVVTAVNLFALDNGDRYPQSVATVGFGNNWNWSDPRKLTGNRRRSPGLYRSMSAYLRSYIAKAETLYCPNAPRRYKYLQQAWDAGEQWDNPETPFPSDPVTGTYCFYWNYIGYLGTGKRLFRGPWGPAASGRYSKLLVCDYFGYDHWRSPGVYGSCEKFTTARVVPETWLLSAYWAAADPNSSRPVLRLQAGYTDGHVETFSSEDVVPMRVSITADGMTPYPPGVGPGLFYLPARAVR